MLSGISLNIGELYFNNMIIDAVVNAVLIVAEWVINLAPDATATDFSNIATMTNTFSQARGIFNWVNFFFPIDTLFQIITLFIFVEFISFLFKLARWIGSILTAGILK